MNRYRGARRGIRRGRGRGERGFELLFLFLPCLGKKPESIEVVIGAKSREGSGRALRPGKAREGWGRSLRPGTAQEDPRDPERLRKVPEAREGSGRSMTLGKAREARKDL